MKNSIWAIGDIHGHYDQMMLLIEKCQKSGLDLEKDTIVFLGDLVDGGLQTKQVIDQIMKWQKINKNLVVLYANHEDLMLDALVYNGRIYKDYYLWWNQGGRETAASYNIDGLTPYELALLDVKDKIPFEHLDWLRNLPYYFETEKYFFIHAGIPTGFTLANVKEKLDNMDSDMQKEVIWIRDSFLANETDWGKKIIFGHTIFPYKHFYGRHPDTMKKEKDWYGYPFIEKNKIGIDGMAHEKGHLIAVELPVEKFYLEKPVE